MARAHTCVFVSLETKTDWNSKHSNEKKITLNKFFNFISHFTLYLLYVVNNTITTKKPFINKSSLILLAFNWKHSPAKASFIVLLILVARFPVIRRKTNKTPAFDCHRNCRQKLNSQPRKLFFPPRFQTDLRVKPQFWVGHDN